MSKEISCDVVVVGAGPGGSAAARTAAEGGASVIIVERKAQIGVPEQCAGYVAGAIERHVRLPNECIAQPVDVLRTFLPDSTVHLAETPGYILNRSLFDRYLALEAVQAGARLLSRTVAVDRWDRGILVRCEGQEIRIHAPIIIGADGNNSIVARWMGLPQPRLARALQYEIAIRERLSAAEVYFSPAFRGGYAWLFPSGQTARVGAAFVDGLQAGLDGLKSLLQEMEAKGVITNSTICCTGGFVPVGGPTILIRDNMLLVGDAGGHTHPITGAGIVNAIIAGEMAGRAAAEASLGEDLSLLDRYQEDWDSVMGQSLEKALQKRKHLEQKWDSPVSELSQIIRQSWITFDEYQR